jgi:hypothetical protein
VTDRDRPRSADSNGGAPCVDRPPSPRRTVTAAVQAHPTRRPRHARSRSTSAQVAGGRRVGEAVAQLPRWRTQAAAAAAGAGGRAEAAMATKEVGPGLVLECPPAARNGTNQVGPTPDPPHRPDRPLTSPPATATVTSTSGISWNRSRTARSHLTSENRNRSTYLFEFVCTRFCLLCACSGVLEHLRGRRPAKIELRVQET